MSKAVSALNGASASGFVTVTEAGLQGMLTVRGDLAALAGPLSELTGCAMPGLRGIVRQGDKGLAWMSPDEVLVFVPYAEARDTMNSLAATLAGTHAMVVDVSDARAVFRLKGAKADQVIAKLCPLDIASVPQGELRRTRVAQTAAAVWRSGEDEISLFTFRSVAGYVMGLLVNAARPGAELDIA